MSKLEVSSFTPETMTDTVYLHIEPRGWGSTIREVAVTKMAKSRDAAVAPRAYVVKVEIVVPKALFADALPSARIELQAGDVVPIITLLDRDENESEAGA